MAGSGSVDVLFVGGGPVGLGTAIEGALAGLSVTVLDPRTAPVDKACGEGIMPGGRAALARLGVLPAGRPFTGIRYLTPAAAAEARFRAGPGLVVRRTGLSAALARRADEIGVRRIVARAGAPVTGPGWVEAGGVRARWLVAADGLHSPTRRVLGLDAPVRGPVRYGLRRHFRVEPWSDLVEVHWSRLAEAYVSPVGDATVGVAILCPRGRDFDGWLAEFPDLRRRLARARPETPVRGCGPLRVAARRRVHGRVLLVGDAAGYVDALTGEGISVGLQAGRRLVRCLVEGRAEDYEREWREVSRRHRAFTAALVWAANRPLLRRRIVPAARCAPGVFAAIVDRLS